MEERARKKRAYTLIVIMFLLSGGMIAAMYTLNQNPYVDMAGWIYFVLMYGLFINPAFHNRLFQRQFRPADKEISIACWIIAAIFILVGFIKFV